MEKDVLQTLTEDHAVLAWLAERLTAAKPGRARAIVFDELSRALGAHQTVIDQTVLPALKAFGWAGVTSDVLTGHVALKRLLAEVLTLERRPDAFEGALPRLVARLEAQCRIEREKLMPVLRHSLDENQRSMMAFEAELHLTRLLGDAHQSHDDSELPVDAGDLVEEAYVVLGSLPSSDEQPQR